MDNEVNMFEPVMVNQMNPQLGPYNAPRTVGNLIPVEVASVIDPRLNLDNTRRYVALKGSKVNNWQQFPATTFSTSTMQVTCNPPNQYVAVSRRVLKSMNFSITINGTNSSSPPANLLQPGYYSPRAYPLVNITNSEQMTFNNCTITQAPMYQYWGAIMRYHNRHQNRFGQYSLTPSMLDQFQNYSDGVNTVRNPLAPYGDNSFEQCRGGYSGMVVSSQTPGNTSATMNLTVIEPIFLSPMAFGESSDYCSSFIGLQNMAYTSTFSNLARLLSLANPNGINITSVSVVVNGGSLYFEYLTPPDNFVIPRSIVYPYFNLTSYPTQTGVTLSPNASSNLTMNSIQVNSIPRRMYIFSRLDDTAQSSLTSDAYMRINTITVNWNNNIFISNASAYDLYLMSVKNGYQGCWDQWNLYNGSVLCVDFGTDIGLNTSIGECPGVLGNYQLAMTVNVTNLNQTVTITPTLYVVVVGEGTFNITAGNCLAQIGVLNYDEVRKAPMLPGISYKVAEDVYGGNFFDQIKNAVGKVINFGRKVAPYVNTAAQLAGIGYSGGKRRKKSKKSKKSKKTKKVRRHRSRSRRRGGVLVGGNIISRDELGENLEQSESESGSESE